MKLYTKRGDDGCTELVGGARVSKDHPRVVAYGTVDELNCAIGAALPVCDDEPTRRLLEEIAQDLFTLGSQLATQDGKTPKCLISDADVARLECGIDDACAGLPPQTGFILPGGSQAAARLHQARTVCRRAERCAITLAHQEVVSRTALIYLNRLSDLLHALARRANHRLGVPDVPWKSPSAGSSPG